MGKKHRDEDGPRIIIQAGEEPPEANNGFLALLRDSEKIPPVGGEGTLVDRLGGVFQDFMAHQIAAASAKRAPAKGKVTLTFGFTTGPDGSHSYTCEAVSKAAKAPARPSMVFTNEAGDLLSSPVEPLIAEMHRRERAAATETPTTEPKAGAVSKV